MTNIKFFATEEIPLEMHRVSVVSPLKLVPVEDRLKAIKEAGFNNFLLKNKDVFLDMLTDSGVNAMSTIQQASMFMAEDSYAGSATFTRLEAKIKEIFGMKHFLPTHQGRASENIISQVFVKEGSVVPMNFHFTTAQAHIDRLGGRIEEVIIDEGLVITSDCPFKGNIDLEKLENLIKEVGPENVPFIRIEAGTNLIGGQPVSLQNIREVKKIADKYGTITVMDASLLMDNLYFNKIREPECKDMSIREITKEIMKEIDIMYFSARKLGFARGGGIATNNDELNEKMKTLIPLFEGFLTYGGMSVREMEAITVGLDETMEMDVISQGPEFIKFMVNKLDEKGIPVVTPPGGLGCHLNAGAFVDHVPQDQYPSGALAAALFIAGGIRGMERGTLSEARKPDGSETLAAMELLRLALPRRVFTLSQVMYTIDRIQWLYENRELIGGLRFVKEPETLRFFIGELEAIGDWPEKLAAKFREDFGDSL